MTGVDCRWLRAHDLNLRPLANCSTAGPGRPNPNRAHRGRRCEGYPATAAAAVPLIPRRYGKAFAAAWRSGRTRPGRYFRTLRISSLRRRRACHEQGHPRS